MNESEFRREKYKRAILGLVLVALTLVGAACRQGKENDQAPKLDSIQEPERASTINSEGMDLATRIGVPPGFERVEVAAGSFAEYLRQLPLKPDGAPVLYHDGREKRNAGVYVAVVEMSLGDRDLQQCADAIMRLRGEYFWGRGEYEKIAFNFTNGFPVPYSKWMEGYRISFSGNTASWYEKTSPSNTYEDFLRYMDIIFAYAGTLSLEQELVSVPWEEMEIGDVLIRGGSPGHAVLVVDMAENKNTGEKLYLLAQSYMPAQDTQLLANPSDAALSPWYALSETGAEIRTPEWTFTRDQLRRFPE
jgi:hypothetical protein